MEHFKKLYAIDCKDKIEEKDNGSVKLKYLSWCYAWAETKKIYPDAQYEILKFGENQLPYIYDEKTGYMVFTKVTIENITHEMWLPVMDSANKAMKDEYYTYTVKTKSGGYIEKEVKPATMFDINKTIMRCLTKNLAMFGLGLYIYAGEDLPDNVEETTEEQKKETKKVSVEETEMITENQKTRIKNLYSEDEIKNILKELKKSKLGALTLVEASNYIKARLEEK